jgi:hypothetical protein
VLEERTKWLNESQVLGDKLSDLWEKETNWPSRCIILVPGLVVAEDKQHLPVMEKQVSRD